MKLYELIDSPEKWTRCDELALDANGHAVWPNSPAATAWCSVGGLLKLYGDGRFQESCAKLRAAMDGVFISKFNGSHTYEEVRAKWIEADV